jgi:hypothetical protein
MSIGPPVVSPSHASVLKVAALWLGVGWSLAAAQTTDVAVLCHKRGSGGAIDLLTLLFGALLALARRLTA